MNKTIAPSILGIEKKATKVNELIDKGFNFIHYDVMDGIFVKKVSLEENELRYVIKNTKNHIINLHLMVADPEKYIKLYKGIANYITFHYESESIDNIKKIIKEYGSHVNLGIAINPKTNIEQIYEYLPDVSHILIMSVVAGKGGQAFIEKTLLKTEKLKKYIDERNLNCFIQMDGGINNENGHKCISSGATNIVSGSYLMNNLNDKDIKNKILGIKK